MGITFKKKENNMFQSMGLTLTIYQFLMVFHKVLFLDHYYFFFISIICIHLFFYEQYIFDPRPEYCLSFSKKSPQKIV